MPKFIIKEQNEDGSYLYYAGEGKWTNNKKESKVCKTKNILLKLTTFENDFELEAVK